MVPSGSSTSRELVRGEVTVSIKPQVREMTAQGKGWYSHSDKVSRCI
jgi:hypothetical protein